MLYVWFHTPLKLAFDIRVLSRQLVLLFTVFDKEMIKVSTNIHNVDLEILIEYFHEISI